MKPQKALGWISSFEKRTGRKPPYHDLFIKVFGAPCNFAPMNGAVHKRAELTEDGWFVGVQWPMALVMRKSDMKVVSVSRKKLRVYEGIYLKTNVDDILHQGMIEIKHDEQPKAVTSVKSLRSHVLNQSLINPIASVTPPVQQAAIDAGQIDQGRVFTYLNTYV